MDERLVGERDEPSRDVEKREPPPFDGGSVWFRCSGTVPLEATNSAPAIDQVDLGRSPEGIAITGGCDFDLHRSTLSGSFVLLGNHRAPPPFCAPPRPHALEPKLRHCSGCLTERVRPRRSSRPRRFPPRPILADRSARRRSVAPCSRPWGSPGFGLRRQLRASRRRRFPPRWRTPYEAFPPQWSLDRHRRLCSRGMGVHRSGAIHRGVRSALATFPSEGSRCFPGIVGMRSGVAPRGAFPLALIEPIASRSRQRAHPWTCPFR